MSIALNQAKIAFKKGDVPVGVCIVNNVTKKVVSKSYNKRMLKHDATAHAEVLAIKSASKKIKDFRLTDFSMFVTLFPCPMCMGAIVNARIDNIFVGTNSDRVDKSLSDAIFNNNLLNHKVNFEVGILEKECSELVKKFFAKIRK